MSVFLLLVKVFINKVLGHFPDSLLEDSDLILQVVLLHSFCLKFSLNDGQLRSQDLDLLLLLIQLRLLILLFNKNF